MNFKKSKNNLLAYGVYTKHIEAIKHYDGIQTKFRSLTSTLLLGIFAATGFLFTFQDQILPVHIIAVVACLCLLGIGAVTIFCLLDLVFQERLIIANFIEALKLEEKYKWLEPIHHNMIHKGVHFSSPSKKVIFYIGCGLFLFFLFSLSLYYYVKSFNNPYLLFIPFLFLIIFSLLYSTILIRVTGKLDVLIKKTESSD